MNKFDITFEYNEETDILTISLGTGEPSYSEEIDDIVLVDRGYFSGQITGFQIMDVRHHGIKEVQVQAFVTQAIKQEKKDLEHTLQQRNNLANLIQSRITADSKIRRIFASA